jgi:hypothetical protein
VDLVDRATQPQRSHLRRNGFSVLRGFILQVHMAQMTVGDDARRMTAALLAQIPYEMVCRVYGCPPNQDDLSLAGFFAVWAHLKVQLGDAVLNELEKKPE